MTKKEKEVLEKAVKSSEGFISPASMINSYAKGDHALVERLVSLGYLERVYQFKEGLNNATYSIIFYSVTEKGLIEFEPFHKKILFNIKSQITFYVGITSIVVSILALLMTIIFSYKQNLRENLDHTLRNRPYLVTEGIVFDEPKEVRIPVKNVGILPAKIINSFVSCPPNNVQTPDDGKIIIGNGQTKFYIFHIDLNVNDCIFEIEYTVPVESTKNVYKLEHKFTINGNLIIDTNSSIR